MEAAYFSNIRRQILNELEGAQQSIRAAVCWFTNYELFQILCRKLDSGIRVELIVLNDYINNRQDGLDFQSFINLNGSFYFSEPLRPMHNKYCIIDDTVLINGSYNWTYYADWRNEENIIIHKNKLELTQAFIDDFERIKSGLAKIEHVSRHANYEIQEFDLFGTHNYLANDYLFKAQETKDISIANKALELNPSDIKLQQLAVDFKFRKERKTKHSIGQSVNGDRYSVYFPIGTPIPSSFLDDFQTSIDFQKNVGVSIRYGENENASVNIKIGDITLNNIPQKKAGEVKLFTTAIIEISGKLSVTKEIKGTGIRSTRSFDINHLLTEG